MTKLLTVFAIAMALAYISEQNTKAIRASGEHYSVWKDWAYIGLAVALVLFAGLRTTYNDTGNYIDGFERAPEIYEWLADPENLNPFKNPLFYLFQSLVKTATGQARHMIFLAALFSELCFLWFFKRYAPHFLFSVFIFFTLGTFVFTLAAIKQVLGMAILTLGIPCIEKKKWGRFYLVVLLAALFHTYALMFAVLPLFRAKPWSALTFCVVLVVAVVMMNFEEAISAFMDQANDLGKTLADYEVFADATINVFRLAVYVVPPAISLIFRKWVLHNGSGMDNVFIHMSIMSLAFMCMGTQAGANMFGRMGNYFELGTICCLPWMLEKTFVEKSYRQVAAVACVCFFGFFYYANAISLTFDVEYNAMGLLEFFFSR